MPSKSRILYIMQMLNEQADEEHPIIITQIIDKLSAMGIAVTRKTIVEDIAQLKEFGLDVICIKSTQNRYFIGERRFNICL